MLKRSDWKIVGVKSEDSLAIRGGGLHGPISSIPEKRYRSDSYLKRFLSLLFTARCTFTPSPPLDEIWFFPSGSARSWLRKIPRSYLLPRSKKRISERRASFVLFFFFILKIVEIIVNEMIISFEHRAPTKT